MPYGALAVTLMLALACGETPQSAFDEGNEAFARGLYPKATIRLVATSVPPGSTVAVETTPLGPSPQHQFQAAPDLWMTFGVTSDRSVRGACIQAFAATPTHCIGATRCTDLEAGVEAIVTTPRMSVSPDYGTPAPCALPYTTTEIRVFALGGLCDFCPPAGEEFASAHFTVTYRFVEK